MISVLQFNDFSPILLLNYDYFFTILKEYRFSPMRQVKR